MDKKRYLLVKNKNVKDAMVTRDICHTFACLGFELFQYSWMYLGLKL